MPTVVIKRQIGQKRPATVSASKIYSPANGGVTDVKSIFITNTTAVASTYSIYNDKDGVNYSTDTALYSAIPIAANTTILLSFDEELILQDSTSTLGVQSGTAGSLNFTVYGIETVSS